MRGLTPREDGTVFDVVGIGNALVDIISHVDDAFIDTHDLVKGSMPLVDTDRALHLHRNLGTSVEMSGGSAANTVCGVASLGGRAAYIGKVSDDDLGGAFGHDLLAVGVRFAPGGPADGVPTGRCIIAVTDDAERTMNTYLGASSLLTPADIDTDVVAAARVRYMEGYLYDRPAAQEAVRHAARASHDAGRLVSLTLSDSFCVDRHREDFRALVTDEVDLLFGNSDELVALYETTTLDEAVDSVRVDCRLAAITLGARGSIVVTPENVVEVPAIGVSHVVDTTGAGDLYAAGFLFAHTRGDALADCARIGAIAAAEVIGHVGPRPLVELRTLLR
ncbi:MAG: adenosine kinase [Ilumatobacteraceae bacterium]